MLPVYSKNGSGAILTVYWFDIHRSIHYSLHAFVCIHQSDYHSNHCGNARAIGHHIVSTALVTSVCIRACVCVRLCMYAWSTLQMVYCRHTVYISCRQ